MITILDYTVNNLRSVQKAFEHLGHATLVTRDPREVARADRLVLPGVGSFAHAMRALRERDLIEPILECVGRDRPLLGVCLGMQLLFDWSQEHGLSAGLGVLPGKVVRLDEGPERASNSELKIPHMGWSRLELPRESRLFAGLEPGTMCYFVHSFHAVAEEEDTIVARAEHGGPFVAGVERDNVMGAQFHPEKSSAAGLHILDNFARL